ncbi:MULTISPECIES: hypothetical protein [Pantoea]|jgi:type 1 fimbria pilin|uniref:Type 1 fimbrial protein n=2 Tax=Pantoea TaxID=53335 RepID=A0ABV2E1M3_9GAMM|nr:MULTISPECIES: hypothetical protein [Pantoea]MBD9644174.1 hypothetical protein [Pantoea sp. PNT02]MBD9660524.1 hypothetical protein [Pantoea sp. PNT03]MDR6352003.1 type 1 fimbria pilin [Pantoea sp. SORGH_AS_0659]PLR24800.1 hypothetical protein PZBJ_09825 [Pantoea endophytica]PYG46883.1 hypothetical protein DEU53_111148 [Pantoea sp. AG1095]
MKTAFVLFSGLLFAQAVLAEGGTVSFTGAIVEPACTTTTNSQHAAVQCSQNGVDKVRQIRFNKQQQTLPFQLGNVSVQSSGHIKAVEVIYR